MEPSTPTPPAALANPAQAAQPTLPIEAPINNGGKGKFISFGIIAFFLLLISVSLFVIFQRNLINKIRSKPAPIPTNVSVSPTMQVKKIKQTVLLKKGIITNVPNSTISLIYEDSEIPSKNCADCIATTKIKIKQNENEQDFNYSCGGIAGECTSALKAYGYTVEIVRNIDDTTIQVEVTEQ